MYKTLLVPALALSLLIGTRAQAQELAPGTDIVGYGYDVFGRFADNSSKKPYRILDFGQDRGVRIGSKQYLLPEGLLLDNIGKKEKTTVSGASRRDYAKSFGVSAGLDIDALTFGASVSASFDKSWGGSTRQYFYTVRDASRLWRIGVDERLDLKERLDPQARKDIDHMDPDKLLRLYGTHVIVSAYLGGRADFTVVTKITEGFSETKVAAAASATYGAVTGEVSTNGSSSESKLDSNSRTSLTVTGGNAEFANDIDNYEAYSKWAEGIRAMPVLCDFEKGSLLPIWELASSQARKNAIMNAFQKLAATHPLPEPFAGLRVGMANASFFVKSKATGAYWDLPGFHFDATTAGGTLGLAGKDLNDAGVQGADRFFKIIPHQTKPEYVFFQPQHALEVVSASEAPGTPLKLAAMGRNDPAEMFKMIEAGPDGTYRLQNAKSGLFLTAKGQTVVQEPRHRGPAQKWVFEKADPAQMAPPPAFRTYRFRRRDSNLGWDVDGAKGQGARIKLWPQGASAAQVFYLEPVGNGFLLVPMHNQFVAADMHPEEGAGLGVYKINRSGSQKFVFEWAGAPRVYKIRLADAAKYVTANANDVSAPGCHLSAASAQASGELQSWAIELTPPMRNDAPEKVWHSGKWTLGTRVLLSKNKRFSLVFQSDGNLVVYRDGAAPIWSSNTANVGAREFVYQADGNLVIYGDGGSVKWASGSDGKQGEALFLQDDGNLVLHAPGARVVWATR